MHLTPTDFSLVCTNVCLRTNHKMCENLKLCQGTEGVSILLVSIRIWEMLFKY